MAGSRSTRTSGCSRPSLSCSRSSWPPESVRQALLRFRQERVSLPSLEREPGWGERVTWRLPVYNTILKILTNPCYAGAYAFGRTATRTAVIDGRLHKTRGHRQGREQWIALLRDHHEPH